MRNFIKLILFATIISSDILVPQCFSMTSLENAGRFISCISATTSVVKTLLNCSTNACLDKDPLLPCVQKDLCRNKCENVYKCCFFSKAIKSVWKRSFDAIYCLSSTAKLFEAIPYITEFLVGIEAGYLIGHSSISSTFERVCAVFGIIAGGATITTNGLKILVDVISYCTYYCISENKKNDVISNFTDMNTMARNEDQTQEDSVKLLFIPRQVHP